MWREWRAALDELRPPAYGVVESLLVLVGGVLLVTPPVRRRVAERVRRRVEARLAARSRWAQRP